MQLERALEELNGIEQIVSSETALAVLTTSGLVYQLSLSAGSHVSCLSVWNMLMGGLVA